jgi:hypothetical protein
MSRFYYYDSESDSLIPLGILHMIHDFSLVKIEEDLEEEFQLEFTPIPMLYNELDSITDEDEVEAIDPHIIDVEDNFELPIVAVPPIYNELGTWDDEFEFDLEDPV